MRDIVATIQPDQDDIVRAPLTESICVQGAPGTGKTAVGLHRAAYLLYTHGGQLARIRRPRGRAQPGVPALHRAGAAHPRRGRRRADHGRRPDRPGAGPRRGRAGGRRPQGRRADGRGAAPGAVGRDRQAGRLRPGAAGRAAVPGRRSSGSSATSTTCAAGPAPTTTSSCCTTRPAASGWRCCWPEDARRQKEEAGGSPTDAETRRAARSAEVRAFCDEVWPARDAAGAGARPAATDPARLARAARGILDDDEQALLRWPTAPRSVRTAPWTDGRRRAGRRGRRAARAHRRATATSSSTRRRTSPRCSAARSPAGWPPAR